MKSQEFIDAVYSAGWRPQLDAQHSEIYELWRVLFPTAAILEDDIADLMRALEQV